MDRKILVVDDELDVRRTIETALRSENYHVQTADSGETAITMLESEPFDLVITDIRMPGTDGVEVLQRTKEIDETIEVIILMQDDPSLQIRIFPFENSAGKILCLNRDPGASTNASARFRN